MLNDNRKLFDCEYHGGLIGGIAQLVEHVLCKHEVTGSNPVASTSFCNEKRVWEAGRTANPWRSVLHNRLGTEKLMGTVNPARRACSSVG